MDENKQEIFQSIIEKSERVFFEAFKEIEFIKEEHESLKVGMQQLSAYINSHISKYRSIDDKSPAYWSGYEEAMKDVRKYIEEKMPVFRMFTAIKHKRIKYRNDYPEEPR